AAGEGWRAVELAGGGRVGAPQGVCHAVQWEGVFYPVLLGRWETDSAGGSDAGQNHRGGGGGREAAGPKRGRGGGGEERGLGVFFSSASDSGSARNSVGNGGGAYCASASAAWRPGDT